MSIMMRALVLNGALDLMTDDEAVELGNQVNIDKIEEMLVGDMNEGRKLFPTRADQVAAVTELVKQYFPEAVKQ